MADRAMDSRDLPFALEVAIDGPAGSGKSTVAAALAQRLQLDHVDTGAMYRALALMAQRRGIDEADGEALAALLQAMDLRFEGQRLWVGDEEVTETIRQPEVTAVVSQMSVHAAVRTVMLHRQREMAWESKHGVVMEGRDIGSVVLPLSPCKIYLDASVEERARRRSREMGADASANPAAEAEVRVAIQERDERDRNRPVGALLVSPDAHVVDTTSLTLEQVVDRCAELIEESRFRPAPPEVTRPFSRFRVTYTLAYLFLTALWRLFRLKIYGRDYQQVGTALLYASNHVSWFDPVVLGPGATRELHWLAKSDLFRWPLGPIIRHFNSIPIVRGRYDPKAFNRAVDALKQGNSLIIYPEGTRKPVGRPGPIKKGLGILAESAGVPYLPCFVRGSATLGKVFWGRERLEVWFGPPTILRAVPHLKREMAEADVYLRVGALYLAQLRALASRSAFLHGEAPPPQD